MQPMQAIFYVDYFYGKNDNVVVPKLLVITHHEKSEFNCAEVGGAKLMMTKSDGSVISKTKD